jgi:hypothetical protein
LAALWRGKRSAIQAAFGVATLMGSAYGIADENEAPNELVFAAALWQRGCVDSNYVSNLRLSQRGRPEYNKKGENHREYSINQLGV